MRFILGFSVNDAKFMRTIWICSCSPFIISTLLLCGKSKYLLQLFYWIFWIQVQAHGSDAMVDEDNCVFFLPHRPRSEICGPPFFLFMKGTGIRTFTLQLLFVTLFLFSLYTKSYLSIFSYLLGYHNSYITITGTLKIQKRYI